MAKHTDTVEDLALMQHRIDTAWQMVGYLKKQNDFRGCNLWIEIAYDEERAHAKYVAIMEDYL